MIADAAPASSLSVEQQAVVDADLAGPRLVDAGAGTGKTFTIVRRAAALVTRGELTPDQLLIVTFTKSAATEIADRLEHAFAPGESRRPTCGTFHGIASDLIREFCYEADVSPDIRVIDDGRARGLFARAFAEFQSGRLAVDLSAFPLLDRTKALERGLATLALRLKQEGRAYEHVFARARTAAGELAALTFGGVREAPTSRRVPPSRPSPERTPDERAAEALRERLNVDVVAALFDRFQTLLDRESLLTFGDVIVRAKAMIGEHPGIARALRARWRHAVVDEFQDTNPMQISFLEALFGAELGPVLAVGDVRQAIYEFNGADPRGIIDFRDRARETLPLTSNRRSLQPILDVAHAALARLDGVAPELNAPLSAHRGDSSPAIVRLEIFAEPNAVESEAAAVAGQIRRLVDSGVKPNACAVLLRTRTKAGAFAGALRARGLAVQLHGGVGFFEAPEIREVIAWMRLAIDPTDTFAVVGALQSAAVGLGDGAVATLAADRRLAHAAMLDPVPAAFAPAAAERLERFRQIARIGAGLGDARLVDAVRSIIEASGAEVARASDESLPQVRANLEKLVRFAAGFADDRPFARLRELVEEFRERDELELDLPLAELDGDRVPIMTVHGAKGLEWDHVFVANVSAQTFPLQMNDAREAVVDLDPRTGALALKTGVDRRPTLRWYLARHDHDEHGIIRKSAKDRSEEPRLFYVALTRARDAVYVTGRRTHNGKRTSSCWQAVESWIDAVSAPERHRLPGATEVSLASEPSPTSTDNFAETLFTRIARLAAAPPVLERSGALSYTAIDAYERCPRRARLQYVLRIPEIADGGPFIVMDANGDEREPRSPARYGRVIHRALEVLTIARIAATPVAIDVAFAEGCAAEAWQPCDDERARALAALRAAMAELAVLEPLAAELRFEATIEEIPLVGFIDFIGRDAAGRPVLVDYKTGTTPTDHYALQLALYRFAMRERYPDAAVAVLRVGDETAGFEPLVAATDAELFEAVRRAHSMTSDEPRPGVQCLSCPYAFDVCDAPKRAGLSPQREA